MEKFNINVDCLSLIPMHKSGQDGIMVWGCFHKNGLEIGRVNSRDYININLLQGKLLPYLDTLEDKENFIFKRIFSHSHIKIK